MTADARRHRERWEIEWRVDGDVLRAIEPTPAETAAAVAQLATYYNDAHNRRMMAHDAELSHADVATYYDELRAEGGRPFLLERAAGAASSPDASPATFALIGDGDVRNIEDDTGELAIMIGAREAQGRGLGLRYAIMLHAFAFRVLEIERIYVSIIPANAASRRLFDKLGYQLDDSPEAREFADEDDDVTMSIARAELERARAAELAEIRLRERRP